MRRIEGMTGTIGAGKGTLAEYLVREYGYLHLQVRRFLEEELAKRSNFHIEKTPRVRLQLVANDLRQRFGPEYVVAQLFKIGIESNRDFIIESFRSVGEVEFGFTHPKFRLWSVDADREIRYQRILARQDSTDKVSYQEFCANEDRELNSTSKTEQNLRGCMELANISIMNNLGIKDFYSEIDRAMMRGGIEIKG